MKTVSLADAKTRLSELIEQLAEEEEIVITRHGQPVARLVPASRHRLSEHSISAPIAASQDPLPAGEEGLDSGPLALR
jgi:prevent-host-death family protein